MRVLLTDGSGATSRQVATQLAAARHVVGAVTPRGTVGLARLTRWVRQVHPVTAFGEDPLRWLVDTTAVIRAFGYEVLLPTHEQAAVLALEADRLVAETGVALAVPPFASLARVQDKVAAFRTLTELGLPQPPSVVVTSAEDLRAAPVAVWPDGEPGGFPLYVKLATGTASSGVRLVATPDELAELAAEHDREGRFDVAGAAGPGLLVQRPVPGRLAMVQSVFDHGRLVAFHANLRAKEGPRGGAAVKESVVVPEVQAALARLGGALRWHGGLSADVLLDSAVAGGAVFLDINPRIVEPGNAWRAGVDLVDAMLRVSTTPRGSGRSGEGGPAGREPAAAVGRAGARTHQLPLALLRAAETSGSGGVLRELLALARHTGDYRDSSEELIPLKGDPKTVAILVATVAATLLPGGMWRSLAADAVSAYALTPQAWQQILTRASRARDHVAPWPSSG